MRVISAMAISAAVFAFAAPYAAHASGAVTLELQPWPKFVQCDLCVPFQFGVLDMRLPVASIGKLFVHGSDAGAVHIIPTDGNPARSVMFLSIPHERLVGMFEATDMLKGEKGMSAASHPGGCALAAGTPQSAVRSANSSGNSTTSSIWRR